MESLEGSCKVQEDSCGRLRGPGKVARPLHKREEDYRASERGWHQAYRPTPARAIIQDSQCGLLGAICSK